MPKVLANGINIHYLQVGEGPHLMMLHGLMGNLAVWHLKMMPMLRERFKVTTYDLRGHGRSDMPPTGYSTGAMAEDLRGVMDVLGIERTHLVGHSLGADISLHFALRYPDRVDKLVLIEAGIPALVNIRTDTEWEGWRYWAQTIQEYTGLEIPREKWSDLDYMVRLTMDVPIIYGPARGMPRKQAPVLNLLDRTSVVQDYGVVDEMTLANLATIPHPKLMVYDEGSPYIGTYNVLQETLTNCRSFLFPTSKHQHFSPLEQPELLVERMVEFLQPDAVPIALAAQETKE